MVRYLLCSQSDYQSHHQNYYDDDDQNTEYKLDIPAIAPPRPPRLHFSNTSIVSDPPTYVAGTKAQLGNVEQDNVAS
jgi:hypothetical protein